MKALAMVITFCDGVEHLIQQMLIITLNPIARATRKIKKQDRNILLFISFIVIAIYFILIYSSIATLIGLRKQLGRHIIGLLLLLAVIVLVGYRVCPAYWIGSNDADSKLHTSNWKRLPSFRYHADFCISGYRIGVE